MQRTKYYKEKKREERKLDKELGIRYRSWEPKPGESYIEFKRRFKATKLLCLVSLGSAFFFQIIGAVWT